VIRRVRALGVGCALVAAGIAGRSCGTFLVVEQAITRPDAIVSLASHEWERLPEVARLARQYPDSRVVLTLPPVVSEFNCHDCSHRAARLGRMGIEADRIDMLPIRAPGTHGEALATLSFARQARIRKLLVVTSPYHTRRSLATFRRVFAGSHIELGIRPATSTSAADPSRWWRTPYDRWYVRYEWLATVYYAVRYGVSPFAG
jgi:uncharacterized SAM-binding protein YcdF (DUF218 family)